MTRISIALERNNSNCLAQAISILVGYYYSHSDDLVVITVRPSEAKFNVFEKTVAAERNSQNL